MIFCNRCGTKTEYGKLTIIRPVVDTHPILGQHEECISYVCDGCLHEFVDNNRAYMDMTEIDWEDRKKNPFLPDKHHVGG